MRQAQLILITGLPGTGKSTLARALAQRYRLPLICKDTIKEPLFDIIGAADRRESRQLSDASFAVMFSLTRECLRAGIDLILEGNFRAGEHEVAVRAVLASAAEANLGNSPGRTPQRSIAASCADGDADINIDADAGSAAHRVRVAQVLCRALEPVRIARLRARALDAFRHAGHRDADLAVDRSMPPADFLALPGGRFVFESADAPSVTGAPGELHLLFEALERWRNDP